MSSALSEERKRRKTALSGWDSTLVRLQKPRLAGRRMSLAQFQGLDLSDSDGWKYEWHIGVIESEEESAKNKEWLIVANLLRAFEGTPHHRRGKPSSL